MLSCTGKRSHRHTILHVSFSNSFGLASARPTPQGLSGAPNYHAPEFSSNASEFHVTMWNLNYAMDVIKNNPHVVKAPEDVVKDVVKETGDVVKAKA